MEHSDCDNVEHSCEDEYGTLDCAPFTSGILRKIRRLYWLRMLKRVKLVEAELEPSEWVSWKMKGFCKFVGFPIVKHEAK